MGAKKVLKGWCSKRGVKSEGVKIEDVKSVGVKS